MARIHLIIHGHFYQPPRENPWTEEIDRQLSAAPYHDWNARISAECYAPNARSRVQDHGGRLAEVVNNYRHISFNFGPTLFSWLERNAPDTYRRIVEADRLSLAERGHGNAMAQAYNHVILPLASPRDRRTQIRWGLEDFRARFNRQAEGMWLPETAVNAEVMDDLWRAGMKFVILSPSQAEAWREPGGDWRPGPPPTDRVFLCRTASGQMAVFFYHAGLSSGVAFEHLLRDAGILADRIEQAAGESRLEPDRLVLVCSDGESYGHHEKLADMCLAYLAAREAPQRGFVLTNPAAFLLRHPPTSEVLLKPGRDGQGTAWSCAHGVDRWQADCGCSEGGPREWRQAWRAPLRSAFDSLREEIDPLFERMGNDYLKDVWEARDDYIRVLLARTPESAKEFLGRHSAGLSGPQPAARIFGLLEMQRMAMLMYTSCGWFFSDLGGLEAVQNIRYAVRAAELARELSGRPVDGGMLEWLERARSNRPEIGSGRDIVERQVLPDSLPPEKAAACLALLSLVGRSEPPDHLGRYRVTHEQMERKTQAGTEALTCRMTVRADRTQEGGSFDTAALAAPGLEIGIFVRPAGREPVPAEEAARLVRLAGGGMPAAFAGVRRDYPRAFGLRDFSPEVRDRVVALRLQAVEGKLERAFASVFKQHAALLRTLAPIGVRLPPALRLAVGKTASREMERLVERGLELGDLGPAAELSQLGRSLGVELELDNIGQLVEKKLIGWLTALAGGAEADLLERILRTIEAVHRMGLALDEAPLQVALAEYLQKDGEKFRLAGRPGGPGQRVAGLLDRLAQMLRVDWPAA